jgi:predicted ATP-grasp superfamily ATP-dependent carboligase
MKSQQTILVCEFITGGGLVGADLPVSLAKEGALMRDALLKDLVNYSNWNIITTYDARLAAPAMRVQSIKIESGQDVWAIWQQCMTSADAVWAIAPESDGVLLQLARLAQASQTVWIGADIRAIEIASNKYLMAQVLGAAKLLVIPSYFYEDWNPEQVGSWLVKPNDGAGCESTFVLDSVQAVERWFADDLARKKTHIIQPFLHGVPASISVLGLKDQALVLSCNLQSIHLTDGVLGYTGGVVNGATEHWMQLSCLANQTKAAIPGLLGYFGVDVLLDADGVTLVEINPRLTTSYVHLQQALGCNPAHLVMDAMMGKQVDLSLVKRNRVEFEVKHAV